MINFNMYRRLMLIFIAMYVGRLFDQDILSSSDMHVLVY